MKTAETKTVELDMGMDPSERLRFEMDALDENDQMRLVANELLKEFEKDPNLAKAYLDRRVTLESTSRFIREQARKAAFGGVAMIDDETVYGWAVHYVQDGEVKAEAKPKVTIIMKETEEALRERAEAEFLEAERKRLKEKHKKALEREKKKREQSGQLTLFEFFETTEGGEA